MATAEFEELKLSVVLVDEASSGLAALRSEMRNFNADSIRFLTNARGNAEAYKRLGRETDDVVKGLRSAGTAFSRAAGVIGVSVGAYYKIMTTLSSFALEVEQVANAAQLAGVSYADLRNVSEQLARRGLAPESAGRILGALNNLGLQLQSMQGIHEFQNAILNSKIVLKPEQEQAYIDAMIAARGWQERNAIVQNALRNIEKKGVEQNLLDVEIKIRQKEFLTKNNLPEEMILSGDLAGTTKAQSEKYNKLQESAKLWTDIIHKIIANVNTIVAIFNADSMREDGPFYWMLTQAVDATKFIDENLEKWLQSLSDAGELLAKTFAAKPEEEGPPKPREIPPVEDQDVFNPGFSPTSFGDDDPLKLEKLIKEFREFEQNLRGGGGGVPAAPLEQHASLGSMATPGLQLPPAAAAGDIYTRQYPQWPGGGGKPYGSDAGPGRGAGAGGGALEQGFGGGGASGGVGGGPAKRAWRAGDPQYPGEPLYKGKPFPTLSPEATPLPPSSDYNKTGSWESGVSEGRGIATHFSRAPTGGRGGGAWGDPSDPKASAALGKLPDRLQGISLSSRSTLGQFFEVTDPNTGLTHVMQQTDVGPGVRTQNLVDISAQKALQMGYDQKSFEAQQGKKLWDVRNTGFGLTMGPERPSNVKEVEGSPTQKVLRQDPNNLVPGGDIDAGMANYFGIGAKSGMDIAADRSVLDRGMGNEMGGRLEGGIGLNVDVKGPPGVEATAEGSGIIDRTEVNRETSFGAD